MTDDIRIWELRGAKQAAPVEPVTRVETELLLEDVLTANPHLMMSDLTLVGRQTPVEGGSLDLLGVDEDGRLVVFELKRGRLTREAVAQVIDYCSYLESLTETDLATLIADGSGTNGIGKIDDFQSWYVDRHGQQMDALRPTRMVLVGLGADARAHRMVGFLTERGVDVSLLTFHAYAQGDSMLLARHTDERTRAGDGGPGAGSDAERRRALTRRAEELGVDGLWQDAVKALGGAFKGETTRSGITFSLPTITLPERVNARGSHCTNLIESGSLRVTFFPAAIHVCREKFEHAQATIPFVKENPPNAPPTADVLQQWSIELNGEAWERHREALAALADDVRTAWISHRGGLRTT